MFNLYACEHFICVYDTVYMYACVFLVCTGVSDEYAYVMFHICACIALQCLFVCVSDSVVSLIAFQ